eukprot:SAG31_NODE_1715_length_7461_cov_2.903695_2_plen_638_part_00
MNQFDTDGSNTLDKAEFSALTTAMRRQINPPDGLLRIRIRTYVTELPEPEPVSHLCRFNWLYSLCCCIDAINAPAGACPQEGLKSTVQPVADDLAQLRPTKSGGVRDGRPASRGPDAPPKKLSPEEQLVADIVAEQDAADREYNELVQKIQTSMKKTQMTAELKQRGLRTKGKPKELATRLLDAVTSEKSSADEARRHAAAAAEGALPTRPPPSSPLERVPTAPAPDVDPAGGPTSSQQRVRSSMSPPKRPVQSADGSFQPRRMAGSNGGLNNFAATQERRTKTAPNRKKATMSPMRSDSGRPPSTLHTINEQGPATNDLSVVTDPAVVGADHWIEGEVEAGQMPLASPLASPSGWGWASGEVVKSPFSQDLPKSPMTASSSAGATPRLRPYAGGRPWSSDPFGIRRVRLLSELPPEPPALPPGSLPPDSADNICRPAAWLGATELNPKDAAILVVGSGLLTAVARVQPEDKSDIALDRTDVFARSSQEAQLQLAIDDFKGTQPLNVLESRHGDASVSTSWSSLESSQPSSIEAVSPVVHLDLRGEVEAAAVFSRGRVTLQLPHCHAGPVEQLRAYFRSSVVNGTHSWEELGRGEALVAGRQSVVLTLQAPGSVVIGRDKGASSHRFKHIRITCAYY